MLVFSKVWSIAERCRPDRFAFVLETRTRSLTIRSVFSVQFFYRLLERGAEGVGSVCAVRHRRVCISCALTYVRKRGDPNTGLRHRVAEDPSALKTEANRDRQL